jgi:hypothetical protein
MDVSVARASGLRRQGSQAGRMRYQSNHDGVEYGTIS